MLRTLHVYPCFLPVYRLHALMAGSRGRTSDDAVQIWPPMGQECLANEDIWDDSELIAHYDRVDAFVKCLLEASHFLLQRYSQSNFHFSFIFAKLALQKKLSALYNFQGSSAQPVEYKGTQRTQPTVNAQKPGSSFSQKLRDNARPLKRKSPKIGQTQRHERLFSSMPLPNASQPKSARSMSLTRLNRTDKTVNPPIPIPPLPVPMKDLESLLRSWYEAGYSLGREHALKKNSMD
ncbi:hypothetical protein FGIG_06389 [Fasciola gigantica]|uniref:Survival Motor Neuron Gemin2-binding domain-containing protein n=1 Tax=Fasciola gigantica TaxID=46835 RepID=A0A504YXG8_FASGI|nr:hypothetical protein FGIG_06389 [Fasciola gigantica]